MNIEEKTSSKEDEEIKLSVQEEQNTEGSVLNEDNQQQPNVDEIEDKMNIEEIKLSVQEEQKTDGEMPSNRSHLNVIDSEKEVKTETNEEVQKESH
jgi:hypothetical protein